MLLTDDARVYNLPPPSLSWVFNLYYTLVKGKKESQHVLPYVKKQCETSVRGNLHCHPMFSYALYN